MINDARVHAIIPARRDSVGLPGKNIRNFCGTPLVSWTISAALKSKYIDSVIVNSNDSRVKDLTLSEFPQVSFYERPEELARSESPMISVVQDCTQGLANHEILILLQPTSPLRDCEDIDAALEKFKLSESDSCVSVSEPTHSPLWNFLKDDTGFLSPMVDFDADIPRQSLPKFFALNGAVYITEVGFMREHNKLWGGKVIGYEMPYVRSIDIDSEIDFKIAELIYERSEGRY
jgi:CMP-N,N'-diacetyllegionaminic acid synthase